jgi:hypothetical protein
MGLTPLGRSRERTLARPMPGIAASTGSVKRFGIKVGVHLGYQNLHGLPNYEFFRRETKVAIEAKAMGSRPTKKCRDFASHTAEPGLRDLREEP